MAKSDDAFRTIGEVSDELSVPKHVLRFWEGKFAQLKPMKRGGGRRFYRPEDVVLLRGIKQLLHAAGYTIKGVQRILREDGVDAVKHLAAGISLDAGPATHPPSGKRTSQSDASAPRKIGLISPELRAHLKDLCKEIDECLALAKGEIELAPPEARKIGGKSRQG